MAFDPAFIWFGARCCSCQTSRSPRGLGIHLQRGPWPQPLGVRAACRRFRLDERATEVRELRRSGRLRLSHAMRKEVPGHRSPRRCRAGVRCVGKVAKHLRKSPRKQGRSQYGYSFSQVIAGAGGIGPSPSHRIVSITGLAASMKVQRTRN